MHLNFNLTRALYASLILALLPAQAIFAQQDSNRGNGLGKAVQQIEKRTGGQILSAEERRIEGQRKYRIKVLTPRGRVKVITVDPR